MAPQKIYIGNLPYYTNERDIKELFRPYGPIHSIIIIEDKDTGYPRGFGFVELEERMAESAICDLENIKVGGRNLRISKAKGRQPKETPKNT